MAFLFLYRISRRGAEGKGHGVEISNQSFCPSVLEIWNFKFYK